MYRVSSSIHILTFCKQVSSWFVLEQHQKGLATAVVVVVAYFILSRLLYLAYSANLGLQCMPHQAWGH